MVEMTIKDIQRVSLEILKHIHQVCEKHGLKYCVFYGTLIGAIRHQGYIPWDDDVDIAMKRNDYEKLMTILKEEESDSNPYYVDHYTTSDDYPYYIMRICDKRYTIEFDSTTHKSGVFVDVYPLDDTGGDLDYWNKEVVNVNRMKKCMILCTYKSWFYGSNVFHKLGNIPLLIYSKTKGTRFFNQKIDKLAKQFNGQNTGYIGVPAWEECPSQIREEWMRECILVPFEDTQVYAPIEYEEVLNAKYDNYMELPPESGRVPNHNYTAYNRRVSRK